MSILIKPVPTATATQVDFAPAEVMLGLTARCTYTLKDVDGNNLKTGVVEMSAEQYALWGTDDDYAASVFLTNLGLEKATT